MRSSKFNIAAFILLLALTVSAIGYSAAKVYKNSLKNEQVDLKTGESESRKDADGYEFLSNALPQKAFFVKAYDICAAKPDLTQVRLRCKTIVKSAAKLGFDSIVLDTKRKNKNDYIYKSDYAGYCGVDVVSVLLGCAAERNIKVYPLYYVNSPAVAESMSFNDTRELKKRAFGQFCEKYPSAGYILTDFSLAQTSEIYYLYKTGAGGKSREEFLNDLTTAQLAELTDLPDSRPVGVLINEKIKTGADLKYLADKKFADFFLTDMPGTNAEEKFINRYKISDKYLPRVLKILDAQKPNEKGVYLNYERLSSVCAESGETCD